MKRNLVRSVLVFLTALFWASSVLATPIDLGTPIAQSYNQQDWPVFIGYSYGQNLGFAAEKYQEHGTYAYTSPTYSGDALTALIYGYTDGPYSAFTGIGLTPYIAIDINQVGSVGTSYGPLTLTAYVGYAGGNVNEYTYSGTLNQVNTGNGDSDWVIPGLNLTGATSLYFTVSYQNNDDGNENFFLVNPNDPPVTTPEPMSLLLLGFGIVGVVGIRRFRK